MSLTAIQRPGVTGQALPLQAGVADPLKPTPRWFKLVPKEDTFQVRFAATTGARAKSVTLKPIELEAKGFIDVHSPKLYKMILAAGDAGWDQYTLGRDEDVARVDKLEQALVAYKEDPAKLREAKRLYGKLDQLQDPLQRRQIEILYNEFLNGAMSPKLQKLLISKESKLSALYNSYRGEVDGKPVSKMDRTQLSEDTTDPVLAKKLWEAGVGYGEHTAAIAQAKAKAKAEAEGKAYEAPKVTGPVDPRPVGDQIREIVDLRNKLATENGYDNYFSMKLAMDEVPEALLTGLMHDLKAATDEPYGRLKAKLDKVAMERFHISAEEANLPWFQAGNLKRLYQYDPDKVFKGKDPLPLLEATANAMGTTLKPLIAKSTYKLDGKTRSSIYFDPENDNKSEHWFSFGINPPRDVRIFGSVDPKLKNKMGFALEVLMHEAMGHGLDNAQVNPNLPYLLRDHHSVTTESHAMLMQSMMTNPEWLNKVMGFDKGKVKRILAKADPYYTASKVAGLRRMMAFVDFERSMYQNPKQDLNQLWWDKLHEYMGTKKPEGRDKPDWAQVPHFLSHPVYYKNYFLAEIRRAQVLAHVNKTYGSLLTPEAGAYFKKWRAPGQSVKWEQLVTDMTGKPLSVDALKAEMKALKLD